MNMKKFIEKDIVVIGAGASGLMFALLNPKKDFVLLDTNTKIGQKIKVSGGGKCNITNRYITCDRYHHDNYAFLSQVLESLSYKELLGYFEGVEFIKRKKDQYFCKNNSGDILNFFYKHIDRKKIFLNHKVKDVEYHDNKFLIYTTNNDFRANKLIVASGGVSFKELGASDIAYKIAEKFGHQVTKIKPALVGFTLQKDDFWMKELSGVSLKVKVKVADKVFVDDLLFTHRGISGPAILNSSLYWEKGSIEIDFLPDQDLLFNYKQKQISSNLPLPKRFIKEFLLKVGVKDKVVQKLNKDDLEKLKILKHYTLSPAGDFGYKKAEVTKGGIKSNEVDSATMQSKVQKNLYFLGECLDITGELGGFNLHFAFSCAKKISFESA